MIEYKKIEKTYTLGGESWRLGPISLSIPTGKSVAIIGSSGSGKSTLLHMAGALDLPSQGKLEVFGEDLMMMNESQKNEYRKNTLGFIFQDFHLLPELTAEQNIDLQLQIAKTPSSQRKQKREQILSEVEMLHFRNYFPKELSGGQRQRIAIARALVNTPRILLADEPTGNLDEATGEKILHLLLSITKAHDITMLCVTHDQHIASYFNHIVQVENGKIHSSTL